MKYKRIYILILPFLLFAFFYCSKGRKVTRAMIVTEKQRIGNLEKIEKSVLKITCSSYYKNYFYEYPTEENVPLEDLLYDENITSNSVAGTGLIIYQSSARQLILTCHHIFDFEDTLKTYYYDKNKRPTEHLSTLSIKSAQKIYIFHKNGSRSQGFIVAQDEGNDLSIIETVPASVLMTEFPFDGKFGDAGDIKLGEEVHLLGFPKGFFMVSRGLASPSNFKNKFMVDAPFNRGFSGGIVVRFIDQKPNYEYIGMANSIAYTSQNVLVPVDDPQLVEQYKSHPYEGLSYVKELKLINYGLTFVIKSEEIKEFLKANTNELKDLGFRVTNLID
ncbi:hypothetical protein GF337_04245 [candidate division KSB1 bacterium]|nr:hypothetical protein [candidate division KSB1 bacterium]